MKKTKTQTKKSKEPIFGSLSLSPSLVGGIVEKGFSGQPLNSPVPVPCPTVLPFPVARHRSHGPHWAPAVGSGDGGNDCEDDEGDIYFDDSEQFMPFALKRKEKKGLDFNPWKEVLASGGSVVPKNEIDNNQVINVKKQSKSGGLVGISDGMNKPTVSAKVDTKSLSIPTTDSMDIADEQLVALDVLKENKVDVDSEQVNLRTSPSRHYKDLERASPAETSGWSEGRIGGVTTETKETKLTKTGWGSSEMDIGMHQILRNDMVSGSDSLMVNELGPSSIESQIDAENRARLENMSAAEIAEAQSEIITKLSSGLLNALKKRGQDKLKGKMNAGSTMLNDDKVRQSNPDRNLVNVSLDDGTSNKMKKDSTSGSDIGMHQILRNDMVSGSDSLMVNELGPSSIESQIDAENRARLENMSAAEIAEAQSEIITKLSPGLLNALKKRGQDKLKGKMNAGSTMLNDDKVRQSNPDRNLVNVSLDDGNSKKMKKDSTSTQSHQVDQSVSHLWSSWSTRVEAVRQLRFSLDGNIIESDLAQFPVRGSVSAQNGYSVENVSERDFLRTEGDPGGIGYTIKEAVSLTRSVFPGQRAIALHLIGAILDKAIHGILQNKVGRTLQFAEAGLPGDWEAIWAFAIGPEPELALSLRISLDDTHDSVVVACAKVIQSVLSCGANEIFFDISEKIPSIQDDLPTAAVFRSKAEVDDGFLGGGFWKYSAKSSNILPLAGDMDDKPEGENTIQDDVIIAGQDIVAGLVRMGILTRIQYLLETEPSASLEECLLSILIAIARHSRKCAAAIIICDRLVQTVVDRFTLNEPMKIGVAKIKSVTLLKVLARMERKNCAEFVRSGILHKVTWHLCRDISLDKWMKSGKEVFGLSSLLLGEQLRLWRVCIKYGYCVSYFAGVFPALRVWLDVPPFEKLIDGCILSEFAVVSKEAYYVLEAIARRLPNFYSPFQHNADAGTAETETWSWTYVGPLINLALEWTAVKKIPHVSKYLDSQRVEERCNMLQDVTMSSLLSVISSAMHMLSTVLEAVVPMGAVDLNSGCLPWLPEFVPRIGLNLIKNGYFCLTGVDTFSKDGKFPGGGSFLELMCHLRCNGGQEASIASTSCIQGLVQVMGFIDKLIELANPENKNLSSHGSRFSIEDEVLTNGIIQCSLGELEHLLTTHLRSALDWHSAQSIEIFGRGGPAPGVGVGWGAAGGGFWSSNLLLAQLDARLFTCLLGIVPRVAFEDPFSVEQVRGCMQRLSSALEICLIAGPRERSLLDKLFDFIFEANVMKCLDNSIHHFLHLNSGLNTFGWKYEEDEYILFSSVLASHFKRRWLSTKKSSKHKLESHPVTKNRSRGNASLDTIYEEMEPSSMGLEVTTSLVKDWAHQRLPLPNHWFLSPISVTFSIGSSEANDEQDRENFVEAGQAGLFFLLGLEAMHVLLGRDLCNVVMNVPVVWKLHALSVMLVDGMCVLESEKSRDTYGVLQRIYGQHIDKSKSEDVGRVVFLNFKSDVHDSYCTFVEVLVEQFAAVSYGDLLFGCQVAIYLHRCVEVSVRLAVWNALSNYRTLELLPCLKECAAKPDGYLEPIEDDEKMLEAYVKSWVSGALDKAATRKSMSYTLALHHLAGFLFGDCVGDKISLRNQLLKSLVRDYAHKKHRKGMMMNLLQYNKPSTEHTVGVDDAFEQSMQLEDRIRVMKEACVGIASLVNEVEKLQTDCS